MARTLKITLGIYGENSEHRSYPLKVKYEFTPDKPMISDEKLLIELSNLTKFLVENIVDSIEVVRVKYTDETFAHDREV